MECINVFIEHFIMNIEVRKTLEVLKSRPDILSTLRIPTQEQQATYIVPNHNLSSLIQLDHYLTNLMIETKNSIRKYIQIIRNKESLGSISSELAKKLELVLEALKRNDFMSIMCQSMVDVMSGEDGIWVLARYSGNFDILRYVHEIGEYFMGVKLNEVQKFYEKKYKKYKETIEEIVEGESKQILKCIQSTMYLMPNNWIHSLLSNKNFEEGFREVMKQKNSSELLHQVHCSENNSDPDNFRISFTALLYGEIEENIYDFLTYLKCVLLNKNNGIMNAEYQIWERLYDVCLKLYCKKQSARKHKHFQIDQLLEQNYSDQEFTNFLLKADLQTISLSSMNFYLKNVGKTIAQQIRPIVMTKIKQLFEGKMWENAEDIIEYADTEANQQEKSLIVETFMKKMKQVVSEELKDEDLFPTLQGLNELVNYCLSHEETLPILLNTQLLKQFQKRIKPNSNTTLFIYYYLNIITLMGYTEFDNLRSYILKICGLCSEMWDLMIKLEKCGYMMHESTICCVEEWIRVGMSKEDRPMVVQMLGKLMLYCGDGSDSKFEHLCTDYMEQIAEWVLKCLREISDTQHDERKQLEHFLHHQRKYPQHSTQSYLMFKSQRDELIITNILSITTKLQPLLPFTEMTIFAVEYLTLFHQLEDKERVNTFGEIQSVLEEIAQEFPIQSMKLVYKQMNQFQEFLIPKQLPHALLSAVWKDGSQVLAQTLTSLPNLTMIQVYQVEEIKRFQFYLTLMTTVFHKLNQSSQKAIKEIKIIYKSYSKGCLQLWKQIYPLILKSQTYKLLELSKQLRSLELQYKNQPNIEDQLAKITKKIRLPLTEESIIQKYSVLDTIRKFIEIGKVFNYPVYRQNLKELVDPLVSFDCEEVQVKLVGETVKMFQLIEYSCPSSIGMEEFSLRHNYTNSYSWCMGAKKLTESFKNTLKQNEQFILEKVLLENLKLEIIKILIPDMWKDLFRNENLKGEQFQKMVEENFLVFENLCEIIESITPGEEEHLIILLESVENLLTELKGPNSNSKLADFLFKAIQTLFGFVFKGIRVRSYHLYRFIKSYHKLTGFSYFYFNTIITSYIKQLMVQFVPAYILPESISKLCGEGSKKQPLESQTHKFKVTTKYSGEFCISKKICLLSMFINLFSRINHGGLIQGIETLWEGNSYRLFYLEYLSKIVPLLAKQIHEIDQKVCDIMNIDCFGNLNIILKGERTQQQLNKLISYVKLVLDGGIKSRIKESLAIPLKILLEEIKKNPGNINIEDLTNTSNPEEIISLVITYEHIKLQPYIKSNLHTCNLQFISEQSNRKIIMESNMDTLEKRMERKQVRKYLQCMHEEEIEVCLHPDAKKIIERLWGQFERQYEEWKQNSSSNCSQLVCSLKAISTIILNNPELLHFLLEDHYLPILYNTINHSVAIFCQLYLVLIKTNHYFNQDNLPGNLVIESSIRSHLTNLFIKGEENQSSCPKYLLECLLFIYKHSEENRFRSYRFTKFLNKPYQKAITECIEKESLCLLSALTKYINCPKQPSVKLKMYMLLEILMQTLLTEEEFDAMKVVLDGNKSLQSQVNKACIQQYKINKSMSSNYKTLEQKHSFKGGQRINQEIMSLQTYGELSKVYLDMKEKSESQVLEKLMEYSLKHVDDFENRLDSYAFQGNLLKNQTNLYPNDDIVQNFEQEDEQYETEDRIYQGSSYGSINMMEEEEEEEERESPRQKQQRGSKDLLLQMYEESVFNPEQMKALIQLIPNTSSIDLTELLKCVDVELAIVVNKELEERGFFSQTPKYGSLKLHIDQVRLYKQLQKSYNKNKTHLIPVISQNTAIDLLNSACKYSTQMNNIFLELALKLMHVPENAERLFGFCVTVLVCGEEKFERMIKENGKEKGYFPSLKELRRFIVHHLFNECIKRRLCLVMLLKMCWDGEKHEFCHNDERVLEIVLRQPCILEGKQERGRSFTKSLLSYLEKVDEFRNDGHESSAYPYYLIHETINLPQTLIDKLIEKMYAKKLILSHHPEVMDYFTLLIAIDPKVFEHYFTKMMANITTELQKIVSKESNILQGFKTTQGLESDQYEREESFWSFRQGKKGQKYDEELEYIRNFMMDFSMELVPKFKTMRFYHHNGKELRKSRLQIQHLREKQAEKKNIKMLKEVTNKQIQLEEWKRNELNNIIREQILPIVEEHSEQFLQILTSAENYISSFIQCFPPRAEQKIIIYNPITRLYQILLATELLTSEEKSTYHSMAQLKTKQSVESSKYLNNNRRRSSINARLSINPLFPSAKNLLRKIGTKASFLSGYLGEDRIVRELHGKYCEFDHKVKVLWLDKPEKSDEKVIECKRDFILEHSLQSIDSEFLTKTIKIKFDGEIGLDYGGIARQWATLLVKDIINPNLGLFELSANKRTFQPSRNSFLIPNHLTYFQNFGMIVGKAMQQNWLLELDLTKSFLKHILGATLYVQDLEDIDPSIANGLIWILENKIVEDELSMMFTYEKECLGKKKVIQLIPGGAKIPVGQHNKKSYVKLLANRIMTDDIRQQSKAFMKGLEKVIPYSTLKLFTYKEISLYFSGMPTLNIQQMRQHSRFENFHAEDQEIEWFWEILEEMDSEEQANFLFFLTGSYKLPYGGFKQYPIGFNRMISCNDYLPVAHTCFSVLDLSSYSCKERMKKLLGKSIREGKGFSVS